jgi:hypothetical protein
LNDNKNILDNPTTSNNSHNLNNNSTITSSITMGQESIFSKKISNMFSTSPFKGFSLTEEEKINKKKLKEKKKEEKRKKLIEKEMKEAEKKYLKEEKRKEKKRKGKSIKAFHGTNEEKIKYRMEKRKESVDENNDTSSSKNKNDANNNMKTTEQLIFNNVMRVFSKTIHEMIPKELNKKYFFTGLLGWGGNGYVAAAVMRETGMPVSIKFITRRCVDKSSLVYDSRFKEGYPYEAYIMENIDHPNIEKIFDIFDDDEYLFSFGKNR